MSIVTSQRFALPQLGVHALVCGPERGTPVVLLHGFPELAESWREVMPIVARDGLRVVAPDLRGYGETDRPRDGYDLATLTGDVVALIDALGGVAHVVGHDWGGAIGYEVAARHPDRVLTLTAVNAPHPQVMARRAWQPAQLLRSRYMLFYQLPWLPERLLSRDHGRGLPARLRAGAVSLERLTDTRLAPYVAAFSTPARARPAIEYYRRAFRALLHPSYWRDARRYPRIRAPFRLIWGVEDRALGRELTVGLDGYFERPVDVQYLDGVGHCAPLEAPARVAALIAEHLRT